MQIGHAARIKEDLLEGTVCLLEEIRNLVTLKRKKQHVAARSSTEADDRAMC